MLIVVHLLGLPYLILYIWHLYVYLGLQPLRLTIASFVLVLLIFGQTQSIPSSIGVGAVVHVLHSIHCCRRLYQPTSRVSSSHITVTLNILLPQMQAKVGIPVRSLIIVVPEHLVKLKVKGKTLHVFDYRTSVCV